MVKRLFFVLMLMTIGLVGAWADEVSEKDAQALANSFVNSYFGRKGGSGPNLQGQMEKLGFYVFNMTDKGGFVIVSNESETTPILGYSETGSIELDPDKMPENMRNWLQGYADEIAWLKQHKEVIKTESIKKAKTRSGDSKKAIDPLITTQWNQGKPYNNQTPYYGVSNNQYVYSKDYVAGYSHCATGCVATAMAQVMNYHKWPQAETSVIPAYKWHSIWLPGENTSLSAVTFEWDKMNDTYTGNEDDDDPSAFAVSTLMKYCGYSVKMNYGKESSSNTDKVVSALKNYFDYNTTTQIASRSYYSYDKWIDLIYFELAHRRPVVYGGQSSGGGHEFVCDGYIYENGTDFFHINWGWGGISDNYFVLSSLDPDAQGIGGSSSNDGFHYGQDAAIGIQKSTENGPMSGIKPNVVNLKANSMTLSSNTVGAGASVIVTVNVTNNSDDDYDGDIYIGISGTLLEGNNIYIPAKQTKDCAITYTPTGIGTYNLIFYWPNDRGSYSTDNVVLAQLNSVTPVDPTNLTVNYTNGLTAEVSWANADGATAYDLDVNGTLIENVTSPYNLTNLGIGTKYKVKVRAKVGDVIHRWSGSYSFTTASTIDVNYALNDSYGDGWNGNAILVIDENGDIIETLTISDGYSNSGTLHLDGSYYQFVLHVAPTYIRECSWSFTDKNGHVLFSEGTDSKHSDGDVLYTIGTLPYSKPTSLNVSNVTSNSAVVSWTGKSYATSFNLRYKPVQGLSYDFESAEPWVYDDFPPFTTYDGDGRNTYDIGPEFTNEGYKGSVIAFQNGKADNFTAHGGHAFGCFIACPTNNNDWFITPEVTISDGDVFSFWACSATSQYGLERFKVGVYGSTNGSFESYLAGDNNSYVEAPTKWTKYSYDLSAYAGMTIKLAINCVSEDAYAFEIDDLFVGPKDITLANVTSPYVLSGLSPETTYEVQVQAVYPDRVSDWSSSFEFTTLSGITLDDTAEDNTVVIDDENGNKVNVSLTNRKLYKDGDWNTICLPFNLTDGNLTDDISFSGTPLEGATVMELDVTNSYGGHKTGLSADGELYLNFAPVTNIDAGTPYIIKWSEDVDNPMITSPFFTDVTISSSLNDIVFEGGKFRGTYNSLTFEEENPNILFLGAGNKLYYPKPDTEANKYPTIGAQRAYFELAPKNEARSFVLNFDDGKTTGILSTKQNDKGHNNYWYDLSGRKYSNKPTKKGVYVMNGKKVVIK